MLTALCAATAALAVMLLVTSPPRLVPARADPAVAPGGGPGWMMRFRWAWSLLGGVAAWAFLGGSLGPVVGCAAAVATWVLIGRAEPPGVRRHREQLRRDLPHVVMLFAAALRSGSSPGTALHVVADALPGPAADHLTGVAAQLELGADAGAVWQTLAAEPALAPLGRTLARAHATGAPVATAVDRLAVELSREARSDVEDRARSVGVKAAVPLGLCLLPAFVLIGIVPLVGGLLSTLDL